MVENMNIVIKSSVGAKVKIGVVPMELKRFLGLIISTILSPRCGFINLFSLSYKLEEFLIFWTCNDGTC